MTKRRKKRNSFKAAVWLILLAVAGVICFLVWNFYFKAPEEPKSVDVPAGVQAKKDDVKKENIPEDESHTVVMKEEIVQYDGGNPNMADNLTGVITYAGVNGENLMIRVNIDQYLSSGECSLSLKRNNNTIYSDTARIIDAASTSTCEGFNVSTNGLGNGEVEILIGIVADGKSGEIRGGVTL